MCERALDFVDECYANEDLSLLSKLTLVIPTYNRNYYLSRCLWYHAHFPFGQIIVADSSPEEKKVVNRETVEKIRSLFHANILYLEYEPETEEYGGDIYRKWADAVQHVEKEYSQIIADKEFVIPTTLVSSISFLQKHQDYMMADANYLMLNKYGDNKYYLNYWRKNQKSLSQDTPIERLENANDAQSFPLMATHRSKEHKKVYSSFLEHGCQTLTFGEIYIELIDMISGKYNHDTSLLHIVRDISHNPSKDGVNRDESSYHRYPIAKDLPKGLAASELICIASEMEMKIMESNGKNITSTNSTWINHFLLSYIEQRFIGSNMSVAHPTLHKCWSRFPPKIRHVVKLIMPLFGKDNSAIILKINAEMKVIIQIIRDSDMHHQVDKSIV